MIHVRLALATDALEIRSGPTSEAVAVDWTAGESLFNEAGFYIRLRSSFGVGSRIAFYAVYAWTGKPKSGESNKISLMVSIYEAISRFGLVNNMRMFWKFLVCPVDNIKL